MKVYQIYFEPTQFLKLEKEYTPYFNTDCNLFFESQVIKDLVDAGCHKHDDYFGVVSYQLRDKLGFMKENWRNNRFIANHSVTEFTPESFERELYKGKPHAMSFQRHAPHDPINTADRFHPGFKKFWQEIMQKIGYNWIPEKYEHVFYCNYFVAESEWYERYVKEMLTPAMKVMLDMPELMGDSGYSKKLPDNLKLSFGVSHYTYHAFLCERMFTYFAHIHRLTCLHY